MLVFTLITLFIVALALYIILYLVIIVNIII